MTTSINARRYVGAGKPADNGKALAEALLKMGDVPWTDLVIDFRYCPAEYVNSALFDAFWQRLYDEDARRLDEARAIHWEFAQPLFKTIQEKLAGHFKPRQET